MSKKKFIEGTELVQAGFANGISTQLAKKQELLAATPAKGQRLQWHRQLQATNQEMMDCLDAVKKDLEAELLVAIRAQSTATMLRSREFSFCLFDRERLMTAYQEL